MQKLRVLAQLQATIERELGKVQRWSQFQKQSGSRPQTTLGHTASIQVVATLVILAEQRWNPKPFDAAFVHQMLALHDLGEIVRADLGQDVLDPDKTADSDCREVEAFKRSILSLPETHRIELLYRVLGQFALKPHALAGREPDLLALLAAEKRLECLLFHAIEYLDYFLYAHLEYYTRGNLRIMVHVLKNHHTRLKALAEQLPGFAQEFYTPKVVAWAEDLLKQYEGVAEPEIPDRKEDAVRKAQLALAFDKTGTSG